MKVGKALQITSNYSVIHAFRHLFVNTDVSIETDKTIPRHSSLYINCSTQNSSMCFFIQ